MKSKEKKDVQSNLIKLSELKKLIKEVICEIERDDRGRLLSPDIEYSDVTVKGEITKLIATLKGKKSEQYTKTINQLVEIKRLKSELEIKEKELKQSRIRDEVSDLFGIENAWKTRVIRTVSAYELLLSKNPAPRPSTDWDEVFKELSEKLTPELRIVAEELIKKYTTFSERSPSVSVSKIEEGIMDKLKSFIEKIKNWFKSFDVRLKNVNNKIKSL